MYIKTFESYINKENEEDRYLKDIIFNPDYFHIFDKNYRSYNARYKGGLIVKFYLREFLIMFGEKALSKIKSWEKFVNKIHSEWHKNLPENSSPILFRGGKFGENENFFCDKIKVACVYSYENDILNAVVLNIKKPLIVEANECDWMNIHTPKVMNRFTHLKTISTDIIVEYAKKCKKYDTVIIKNLWEGSGAQEPCDVYITLNHSNLIKLTNN